MSDWSNLALALFLVALNGFFVAAEFAIVKVRATRITELATRGSASARIAERAIEHLDAYLSATQLGITLASISLGWVGEPAVEHLLHPVLVAMGLEADDKISKVLSAAGAFLTITFLHIVFGELAPKSMAIQRPEGTTLAIAWPLHAFYVLFRIPIVALNGTAALVLRLIGLRPASEHELAHTQEEVRMILTASQRGGHLKANEVQLMQNVIHFADKSVREVMVPRVDVIFLSTAWSLEKNIEVATRGAHSRYPVIRDGPDTVVGFARTQDLLQLVGQPDRGLEPIIREIIRVPETKPVDQLLREFQARREQIALVVDEYSGTAGVVTLEDVLEEIVGEIQDEDAQETPALRKLSDGIYRIAGSYPLADLERDLGWEPESESADTVAGLVMERLGAIPDVGDVIETDGWRVRVEAMERTRIRELYLERLATPEDDEDPA